MRLRSQAVKIRGFQLRDAGFNSRRSQGLYIAYLHVVKPVFTEMQNKKKGVMLFPCIYRITNQINGKMYIGKTLFDVNKRWAEHRREYNKVRVEKRPLYSAMKKYGIENFKIEKIEDCSENDLSDRERYWIDYYDCYKNGYNATHGGDGKIIIDHKKVIDTYLDVHSQKETAKILNIDDHTVRTILRNNNIDIYDMQEVMAEKFGKPVDMIDMNGNIVNTFQSIRLAAKYIKETYNKQSTISMLTWHIIDVCVGKRKTAYGYSWKYKET